MSIYDVTVTYDGVFVENYRLGRHGAVNVRSVVSSGATATLGVEVEAPSSWAALRLTLDSLPVVLTLHGMTLRVDERTAPDPAPGGVSDGLGAVLTDMVRRRRDPGLPFCGHRHPGGHYTCDRPGGHEGDHHAADLGDCDLTRWGA